MRKTPATPTRLPAIADEGRARGIAGVIGLALCQAVGAAVAAFSTRDIFGAFRDASDALPTTALALLAASGLLIGLARIGERVVAERVAQQYVGTLRARLFSHLSRVAESEISRRRAGGLSMRFVGDLAAVRNWVSRGFARLISSLVVLPAATAVLFLIEPRLGAVAVLPLALGLAAMAAFGPRLDAANRRLRRRRAGIAADMMERVPHAPELRLLGRIDVELEQLRRNTDALLRSALARAGGAEVLRAIPDVASALSGALLLLRAFQLGVGPAEAAGSLAALGLMVRPMRDLATVWDRWLAWTVAREKCLNILRLPTLRQRMRAEAKAGKADKAAKADKPDEAPGTTGTALAVRFHDVGTPSLDGVTAEAPAGAKVAIVGPNGAGKTSLLHLAAGLELPARGRVEIDGRAPTELGVAERRRTIALMSPRSPILAGSVRRALSMGTVPRRSDAEILDAAQRFGLDAVLARLGGLDGQIAEGGRNLSLGESRRVLLTRIALARVPVLLLDEPDIALDAEGAEELARALRAAEATVLVVTHDPALVRRLDLAWFVADGRLAEAGPAAGLLDGDGPTARHFRGRPV